MQAALPESRDPIASWVRPGLNRLDRPHSSVVSGRPRTWVFLASVVAAVTLVHQSYESGYDFGMFYYAARMFWEGHRHDIYNLATQRLFQIRYHRPVENIFCSPPFMLLPFLPLSLAPMWVAFVLWTVASVGTFVAALRSLGARLGPEYGDWPLLLSVSFMPVAQCLGQGQLSIVVLAGFAWCYSLWRRGHLFLGGMVLAIGTVKYQLVFGFILVLLLKKKWRELAGFGIASVGCVVASIALVGWRTLSEYPSLLRAEENSMGVRLERMGGLRGLMVTVTGHPNPVVLTAILSMIIVLIAACAWKNLHLGFSAGVIASLLVSYHFFPQDLTVLLVPLFIVVEHWKSPNKVYLVLAAYGLPLLFWAAGNFSWFALPLIGSLLLLVVVSKYRRVGWLSCS